MMMNLLKGTASSLLLLLLFFTGCTASRNDDFSPHPAKIDSVLLAKPELPALHKFVRAGATNEVMKLLQAGADVNQLDYCPLGSTPLLKACKLGDMAMVILLLNHGADIDAMNGSGETALYAAVDTQNLALARMLISKGADVNLSGGRTRWTPLHIAVHRKNKAISALLIDKGANVMLKTNKRKTPLDFALSTRQEDIADIIRKAPTFRFSEPQKSGSPSAEKPIMIDVDL